MIESIVKPQPLDNDHAVIRILQLMGQLSVDDIKYVLDVCSKIYSLVQTEDRLASAHWVAGEQGASVNPGAMSGTITVGNPDIHWETHL